MVLKIQLLALIWELSSSHTTRDINQAIDVFKKLSRYDPKQVYLIPTIQKGWTETVGPSASVLQPPALHD